MPAILEILFLSLGAGLAMVFGGLLARVERIQPKWLETELRHTVIAFGAGALLSAMALVLIPEGIAELTLGIVIFAFSSGSVVFLLLDRYLATKSGPRAQLAAMLLDFIPESIALGATFASNPAEGRLLAFLIGIQNVPEGFNAFREMLSSSSPMKAGRVLRFFLVLSLLGPISAAMGHYVLADAIETLGFMMVFASGGILYLIFQDIAPAIPLKKRRIPALGVVAGFLLGLVAQRIVAG